MGGAMTALLRAEPSHSSTQHLHPRPSTITPGRCFCQPSCPKIPLCSEKTQDFRVSNADFFFPPPILLLLQALNCLSSSSSKEIFVSYWTRNRKSSQGHLTCDVFVSKYQRPWSHFPGLEMSSPLERLLFLPKVHKSSGCEAPRFHPPH